jgi:hypothetical protein
MPVQRFRSIADMPPPWRSPDDPGNLRAVAQMMELHRRLLGPAARPTPGVRKFRSIDEMNADRSDPSHRGPGR